MNEGNKLGDYSKQKVWHCTNNGNERGKIGRIKHKFIQSVFVTHALELSISVERENSKNKKQVHRISISDLCAWSDDPKRAGHKYAHLVVLRVVSPNGHQIKPVALWDHVENQIPLEKLC